MLRSTIKYGAVAGTFALATLTCSPALAADGSTGEGDASASLQLLIDGNIVQTFAPASEDDWAQRSVQVPAQYLDGQSHAVKFDWSADATGSGIGGAMVDDVTLDCSAAAARPATAGHAVAAKRRHVHR